MQMETLAIVRPPFTGDQKLASRLLKGFSNISHGVAMYSSPEVCALSEEALSGTTLLVVSPGQCIEASGDVPAFLSKVTSAKKRVLASVGPAGSVWYTRRLRKGITFDAVLDLGFASQSDKHSAVSDVPYFFVFNGPTRDEEPLAKVPTREQDRPIPWVLAGPKNDRNRHLLAELFEHGVDTRGVCLLQGAMSSKATAKTLLGSDGLLRVLSKARFCLWGADLDMAYYESFRFIDALPVGAVPCKIDPELAAEEPGIPGVYHTVPDFQAEVRDQGYSAMYRRATEFYTAGGRLADGLSRALRLV
jgi:hypothetical protein